MQKIIHRAEDRGRNEHGWLKSRFSFSFAGWHDPSRMGFGRLRVINDDHIAPLGKFGMHPHQNFEIITIPLAGTVTHEDSMGNRGEVSAGEVQAMSAGAGIVHSEYNASHTAPLDLFQIWIEPDVLNAPPRYAQKAYPADGARNAWQLLVAEDGITDALPIHQKARISRAQLEADTTLDYPIAHAGNGAYLLVIEGEISIADEHLNKRDALGVTGETALSVRAEVPSSVLLIEVPMT